MPVVIVVVAVVIGSVLFSILLTNLLAGNTVALKCNKSKGSKTKDSGNKLAVCLHSLLTHRTHSGLLPLLTTFPHTHTQGKCRENESFNFGKLTSFRFVSPVGCRLSCSRCSCCCCCFSTSTSSAHVWPTRSPGFGFAWHVRQSRTTGLDPHAQSALAQAGKTTQHNHTHTRVYIHTKHTVTHTRRTHVTQRVI